MTVSIIIRGEALLVLLLVIMSEESMTSSLHREHQ